MPYQSYAATYNICPNRFVNSKRWKNYSHFTQESILGKKLARAVEECGCEIDSDYYQYETCPRLQVRHLHCVVNAPNQEAIDNLQTIINARDGTDDYVCFKVDAINDLEGWFDYITKDNLD